MIINQCTQINEVKSTFDAQSQRLLIHLIIVKIRLSDFKIKRGLLVA